MGGCSPTRKEKRNDSLVSGWEHGRVRHVGADGTNKKNLSGMDKKTTKEKETKEENKVTNVSLAAGQVLW